MLHLDLMSHAYLRSISLPLQTVTTTILARSRSRGFAGHGVGLACASLPAADQQTYSKKQLFRISKLMTGVLRHDALKLGLGLRPDGYVAVSELLGLGAMLRLKADLNAVQRVVAENDKQRYSLAVFNGRWHVRANQGHSQKVMEVIREDQLLEQVLSEHELPDVCVHGTQLKLWPSILEKGLLVGDRMHVHFAPRLPPTKIGDAEVVSGMRQGCNLIIFLDLPKALSAGLPMYKSSNEVLLTPGFDGVVPPVLFSKAVRRKNLSVVWMNDVPNFV